MKIQKLFLLAAAAASTSAFATPVWTPPEIVLTETSSTALTATIDGSSLNVVNFAPDYWFVYGFGSYLINGTAQWTDPQISGDVNTVNSGLSTFGLGLSVLSDVPAGSGSQNLNGSTDTTDFDYVGASSLPVYVTFNDLTNGSSVPDATTTMPLLGVVAGALISVARRLRK